MRPLLLLTIFLASCVSGGGGDKPDETDRIGIGDRVPEFVLEDGSSGGEFRSPDDFLGNKTLLMFFTTWCPYCQREMPFVDNAYRKLTEAGLSVVVINREEARWKVEEYWSDNGYVMPWWLDPDKGIFDLFAISGVPRFYLVDEQGIIVWFRVGRIGTGDFTEEGGNQFNTLIREFLKI